MSIKIIKPGMLTTIQDIGRKGYQKYGVIESGAMDHFSIKAANILVGNSEEEAALEMTILGSTIQFEENSLIAITGGNISVSIDEIPIPLWRPILVKGGSTLKFGSVTKGSRAYLSVAGGFDIPVEMGSRSTYLRAGIGGYKGRALQAGDVITLRRNTELSKEISSYSFHSIDKSFIASNKTISPNIKPIYAKKPMIRVIPGAHHNLFNEESRHLFFSKAYKIQLDSDRMGFRLEGPPLSLSNPQEILSEVVSFGTVQVPSNGQPIVLMADHQTTGGYPKIAQVISVDLPVLSQLNFGSEVYFQEVSLEEAQKLYIEREKNFSIMKIGMEKNLKNWRLFK
jgi:antagonist of KipI